MPKRKADEDKRTHDVVRPPAPPASNDDDDSDFCDIIEGPIASPGTAVPPSIPPQQSVVASPRVPAPRANPPLPFAAAHPHHDPNNAGVLSMLAGFSGAMPYMQPMHASGFGFRQMPVLQQRHSFGYGPPDMLASQAAFQGRRYPPGPSVPRPVASPVGSSSNGMSSGASSPGETQNMVCCIRKALLKFGTDIAGYDRVALSVGRLQLVAITSTSRPYITDSYLVYHRYKIACRHSGCQRNNQNCQ